MGPSRGIELLTRRTHACVGFLCLLLGAGAPAQQEVPPGAQFLAAINAWRAGDQAAGARLESLSEELARTRPDAALVAQYYLGLDSSARLQGLTRDTEFEELRQQAAATSNWSAEQLHAWPAERARLLTKLRDFAAAVEQETDYVPAANAQALSARLLLAQAERDPNLDIAGQRALLIDVREHSQAALILFERAGQLTPRLDPLWLLADLARVQGQYGIARKRFRSLDRTAQKVGRPEHRVLARLGLLQLARDAGDPAGVERQLAALARITTPKESWPLAREHATSLFHADRPEAALAFLLTHRPGAASERQQWHALLAACLARSGDRAGARAELDQLDGPSALARASLELADGHPADARARLAGLAASDLGPRGRAQAAAIEGQAWLAEGNAPAARHALGRALALSENWRTRLAGQVGSVDGEWLGIDTVVLAARASAECGEHLEAARILEQHQSRSLRAAGSTVGSTVSSAQLQQVAAGAEAGLLTYGIGANESLVVHVDAGGKALSASIPVGRRALAAAIRRLREACLGGDDVRLAQLAAELSSRLLPVAIAQRLTDADPTDRLLLLAHGPLESLPLDLLHLAGVPLGERLALCVLPGLQAAGEVQTFHTDAQPWIFLGAPNGTDLPELPEARHELTSLSTSYSNASLALGDQCTSERLLRALQSGGALHVATHLVRDASCDGTRLAGEALALAHGDRLCAAEIAARPPGPRVPMVVLTACSSGGGRFLDGEGLIGVARALLETGVERLLVTLWPVRDGAARHFAEAFHAGLDRGLDPARAAQSARQALRVDGFATRDWAAFRILGRP
ncbi:MAG: CHAT domain-containing protein [Planctomycetota bacterium]|jgi:CHAT domain-containing protein